MLDKETYKPGCAPSRRAAEHSSGRPTNASPSQVDEEVLLNAERLVSGFEIAGTVALDAMATIGSWARIGSGSIKQCVQRRPSV
jgi:hypothetical protein